MRSGMFFPLVAPLSWLMRCRKVPDTKVDPPRMAIERLSVPDTKVDPPRMALEIVTKRWALPWSSESAGRGKLVEDAEFSGLDGVLEEEASEEWLHRGRVLRRLRWTCELA